MKKNLVRLMAALMSLFMLATFFTGCGKTASAPKQEQSMVYNLGAEPETIDPALNTAVDGAIVLVNCFEGLTRLDDKGVPGPGIAESWDVSPDKLVYTFHLRKDAKFSDGTPITAKDFDYSWRRVIDPNTQAEYVTQILMVKNAEELNAGKCKPEDLGVKVVDDYTLEVTLKAPTPYFLEICAFPTLMPVKKDVVEADPEGWATKAESYVCSGPFMIQSWANNDSMVLVKNPNYWNAKEVKLDKVTFVMVVEESSALTAWEKGDIDINGAVPTAELERLNKEGKVQYLPEIGMGYTCFNVKVKPLDDVRVRQALTLAINRQQICDNVLRAGQKPGTGVVPFGVKDADGSSDFRTVGGDFLPAQGDIEKAKKLLADAGYPDGKGFPKLTYSYNTNETNKAIAEAIQDMWKKNLGIDVQLENLEWKVFIPKRQNGEYQIARGGWVGDYMDPMTFLDIFTSISGNNDPQYENPKYDELINNARNEPDAQKRWQYLHDAEKLLMEEAPIAVINFSVNPMNVQPYVKDVGISALGFIDFDRAWVDYDMKNKK